MAGYPEEEKGGAVAEAAPAAPATAAGESKKKGGKAAKDTKAAAAPPPTGPPPAEKSADELAKMSKEERTAYHQAKRAAAAGSTSEAKPSAQLTKAQRRALQDSQRKVKDDKANEVKEGEGVFEELKLQGLTEEQARAVMNEMQESGGAPDEDEDDDDAPEDLLSSVREWMDEQPDVIAEDALRDFNMKVRFQGHVESTPPDHLGAVLTVLVSQACSACDWAAPKVQPGMATKALAPLLERWAGVLRGLYGKVPDVLEAIGIVVQTIQEIVSTSGALPQGQDCAVVGCLMAVRDVDELVEDEDLLVGCKGIEPRSHVLEKYIEFLEDALEEDDEDESGDD